ncbi:MAG TPA: hypothetical protein PKY82_03910 [Pyrinomonadaceae bacterium]|nr:hypothetical protein [Pyrinomonadaceae bacterium]
MMKINSIFLKTFYERRSVQIFALRLTALCAIFLLLVVYNSAQTTTNRQRTKTRPTKTKSKIVNSDNNASPKNEKVEVNNAVTVVNRPPVDYLSGEASVSVNPMQPTVVRLGLAQNATSVVEFPSVDQIYYIHEGNPKLVTVFQSPTKETDRSITLYPGEGFLPVASGHKELSVTITMQMKSGLVLVLEIVPAPDIRQNAHRCVLNYNLSEVIAARRAAGLKVNLGDENTAEQNKPIRAVSTLVSNNPTKESDSSKTDDTIKVLSGSAVEIVNGSSNITETARRKMKSGAELSRFVNKKLAEAIKTQPERLTIWSPASQGLSLSTFKVVEIDPVQRMILVAVKNETTDTLRLLEEMPELKIQTVDKAGNSLQIERLTRKYTETTALEGAIPAGAICYYAIVYENPVLGANQKLLVSAAHDRAADSPVVTGTNQTTGKEGGKQ